MWEKFLFWESILFLSATLFLLIFRNVPIGDLVRMVFVASIILFVLAVILK